MNPLELIRGYVRDGAVRGQQVDIHNPGEYNASTGSRILGALTGVNVDQAVDDATDARNLQKANSLIGQSEFSKSELSQYGDLSTPDAVRGAISRATRQRNLDDNNTSHTQNMQALMAPVEARLKSQEIAAETDRDIRNKQFLLTWQQGQNDRADARLQHADELALRREQMEREDMRYNENIARMDRKDRQQSIQTLVAGLANLGAAFAL